MLAGSILVMDRVIFYYILWMHGSLPFSEIVTGYFLIKFNSKL